VSGAQKRDILAAVLRGPVTAHVPASVLRTIDGVTLLADRAALPAGGQAPQS